MTEGGAPPSLRVFIVAGEHSGDHLGAGLIRALRERTEAVAAEFGGHPQADEVLAFLRDGGERAICVPRDGRDLP